MIDEAIIDIIKRSKVICKESGLRRSSKNILEISKLIIDLEYSELDSEDIDNLIMPEGIIFKEGE